MLRGRVLLELLSCAKLSPSSRPESEREARPAGSCLHKLFPVRDQPIVVRRHPTVNGGAGRTNAESEVSRGPVVEMPAQRGKARAPFGISLCDLPTPVLLLYGCTRRIWGSTVCSRRRTKPWVTLAEATGGGAVFADFVRSLPRCGRRPSSAGCVFPGFEPGPFRGPANQAAWYARCRESTSRHESHRDDRVGSRAAVLEARFGELPADLRARLDAMHDPDRLDALVVHAARAADLDAFLESLDATA